MKLKWTRKKPTKEGGYFWKKKRKKDGPWFYRSYFVKIKIKKGVKHLIWYELSTKVDEPEGGWFARVKIGKKED